MDNKTFTGVVDTMVRLMEDNQLLHEGNRQYMSSGQWMRDMSTVNMTVPRQIGKTTYIIKRATCADLVVVHSQAMKDFYKGSRATVLTPSELTRFNRGRMQRGFHRVYVDEPRMVFDHNMSIEEFYSMFNGDYGSSYCANMFVLLGT